MFTTDSRAENFIDSVGGKFRYTNDMKFSLLTPDWRDANLGRSQVRIDGAVLEYGSLMDKGSAAPAPILWKNKTGRHEVLDGIQRLLAEWDRHPLTFSAYIVDTDSKAMASKIRVFSNYRLQGGYQESAEWTLSRAIEVLVGGGAMSLEEVADIGGWSLATVRDKKQNMDYGDAIRNIGGPAKLPDSIVRIVAKNAPRSDFADASKPLCEFFSAIKKMRLSAEEAEPHIEGFFAVPRHKGKLFSQFTEKLAEFHKDEEVATRLADPTRRRYQPITPEGRLMRSLKSSLTTARRIQDKGDKIPYVAEYFQVLSQTHKVLRQIETQSRRK